MLDTSAISPIKRRLIGAYFCHEYSYAAAALMNPSIVLHPDQSGLDRDQLRFVMSMRAVGEGHISSIAFREGIAGPDGDFKIGRASCRERVCMYVLISVVAVSLKKKK